MMRGPEKSAMAVRRPNGEIFFEEKENPQKKRPKICRLPIIRGVFGFVDSMVMGYHYLMRSAEIAMEEETPAPKAEEADLAAASEQTSNGGESASTTEQNEPVVRENVPKDEGKGQAKKGTGKAALGAVTVVATVLGIALAIFLFVWLPSFLFSLLKPVLPASMAGSRYARSIFEGVLKILILVLYMLLVSLMKDIRRTFMYHGAEHKTIFCYEHGLPLTVENVRKQRRFHPRCGTSFLILMLIVSIVVGLFIPVSIAGVNETLYTVIRAAIKLLLIPLVMGIGYELLKFAGRHDNIFTRVISAPGMWLQHITVREPSDDMIECAIRAFVAVLPADESDRW